MCTDAFNHLMRLLDHIQFDPRQDRLGFVGDLVNRGPQSLETLRFIKNLTDPVIVLGNHDLYLIAWHYHANRLKNTSRDLTTLFPILKAPDREELMCWLSQCPFMYQDKTNGYCLVHAGIPPIWSESEVLDYAAELSEVLQSDQAGDFFEYFEHQTDPVAHWSHQLTGCARYRYIANALTRMRFCDDSGRLDLTTSTKQSAYPDFKPWFAWRQRQPDVIFGHWATLKGQCDQPGYYALDTGAVWGGTLSALRIEDRQCFSNLI